MLQHAVRQFIVQRLAASKASYFVVQAAPPIYLLAISVVLNETVAFYYKGQKASSVPNELH